MSLYYDAASILTNASQRGSLKSRVYAKDANFKSKPAHVHALISETAKYDAFLKEVIDNAGLLAQEPKLNPLLAILIVHDHFFAKGGIATAATHPLRQSVERHKARLQSEFTKARLKRRVATVDRLKAALLKEKGTIGRLHPRWARVNTLKSDVDSLLSEFFPDYQLVDDIGEVIESAKKSRILHVDKHVPNLLAFPPEADLTKTHAYIDGKLILQDKASCFPAHLLVGDEPREKVGGLVDGCAAPGNKTTHVAAIMKSIGSSSPAYACERDATRSKILQMMVAKAGVASSVIILAKQDFLALDPHADSRFQELTHFLLDPSCSGSGILGREDIPALALPNDPKAQKTAMSSQLKPSKKRKRGETQQTALPELVVDERPDVLQTESDGADAEQQPVVATKDRLEKLSNLQSRIVEHAFRFPAAQRVTYSTCSVHVEENEAVVQRVLESEAGRSRGWRVLSRPEQVEGMRLWNNRGVVGRGHSLAQEQREACIRCTPDDGEGTMGFFVCGFVRDSEGSEGPVVTRDDSRHREDSKGDDDWEGFSDA